MATQNTKIIDVTRGFIPVDPNAFPETYNPITKEDGSEAKKEIVPYEGYNFMPTSYGYKSYFGTTSSLNIAALTSRVDEVFIVQTNTFLNIAVALCEDGIWTKAANATGAWIHEIVLTIPVVGVHNDWSKCTIGNDIFCYRKGEASYHKFSSNMLTVTEGEIAGALPTVISPSTTHAANLWYSVIPTFLNMVGQEGIFKAGSRLGFWDSANSTAWSSIDDFAEFTPSVTTLAGSSIFIEITGRIVNILSYGDGFIIYATKSIIYISRDESSTFQWNPVVVMKEAGIAFRKEACVGNTMYTQYAYSSAGLIKIEKGIGSIIVPEVTDFLKDSTLPIFLTLLEGRYLFLQMLDSTYIDGLVSFTVTTVPSSSIVYPPNNVAYSPENSASIDSIFDGTNLELQSLLDAYLLANSLPARGLLSTYTPIWDYVLHDSGIHRPVAEVAPGWTLTNIDANTVELTGINALLVIDQSNTTIIPSIPIRSFALETMQVGTSGLYHLEDLFSEVTTTNKLCIGTPVIAPAVALVPPSSVITSTWGVSEFTLYQKNLWDTNEFNSIGVLNYINVYATNNIRYEASLGGYYSSGLGEDIQIWNGATVPNSATEQNNSIYSVKQPTILTNLLYTYDSWWSVPTTSIENGVVRYKRTRTRVTSVYLATTISKPQLMTKPLFGSVLAFCTRYNHDIYALSANTETLANNPVQEATASVSQYNYTDNNGIVQTVAGDLVSLPTITPFYYNGGGTITLPPSSFLLQNGSIGPVYPTIPGALVYDLELKKWGKMKVPHKVLVDWSPLNNISGDIIPHEVFGVTGGVLKEDGKIALFDKYPIDSYIKYGKIGYFRQGFTSAEEIRISFRSLSQGTIRTEASLDGYSVELGLTKELAFTPEMGIIMNPSTSARWHTVTVIGNYDIKHMEFRGTIVGNR